MTNLQSALDAVLDGVVSASPGVPGVVAMVTDRKANVYEGAAGERLLGSGEAMTTDSVFAIFSTTKAITGTAVMQCVEEGKLDLDAPASDYAPAIGKLQVIDGFDADGSPRLRAPRREITTRMLMLHTAGFGYDFFNETYSRLASDHGQPSVVAASRAAIETPLLFDPATAGNTAPISTGAARWLREFAESGSARFSASGYSIRSAWSISASQ